MGWVVPKLPAPVIKSADSRKENSLQKETKENQYLAPFGLNLLGLSFCMQGTQNTFKMSSSLYVLHSPFSSPPPHTHCIPEDAQNAMQCPKHISLPLHVSYHSKVTFPRPVTTLPIALPPTPSQPHTCARQD